MHSLQLKSHVLGKDFHANQVKSEWIAVDRIAKRISF